MGAFCFDLGRDSNPEGAFGVKPYSPGDCRVAERCADFSNEKSSRASRICGLHPSLSAKTKGTQMGAFCFDLGKDSNPEGAFGVKPYSPGDCRVAECKMSLTEKYKIESDKQNDSMAFRPYCHFVFENSNVYCFGAD